MDSLTSVPAAIMLVAIPSQVAWSYAVGGVVAAIGLTVMALRGEWLEAQGLDKLILFGPIFYAAPLAAFGTEHFTLTKDIASIVPAWIPWHYFWAYFVGACFIAAGLSLVTGIRARVTASLLAATFFLFVALMDFPGWLQTPRDRFAIAIMLRELSFSGGALALAASLSDRRNDRWLNIQATAARYFIAIPVLYYSLEQFLHAGHVPGIPLELVTPTWIRGHAVWTYVAAVAYAVTGAMLVAGKKTRLAAAWLGATVLFVELVVYLPLGVVDRVRLDNGLNYPADTLMYCGAVLLMAGAMPRIAARGGVTADGDISIAGS